MLNSAVCVLVYNFSSPKLLSAYNFSTERDNRRLKFIHSSWGGRLFLYSPTQIISLKEEFMPS